MDYAVDRQDADPDSMLELYRRAIAARRTVWLAGTEPTWDVVPGRDDVLVLVRGRARTVVVFGTEPVELPTEWGEIVVASAPVTGRSLPGNAAAWLHPQGTPAVRRTR